MPDQSPLSGVDLLLADLDGVVYKGADAIPYAVESINLAAASMRVGYLTNNASRTDTSVARHLTRLGLAVAPEDVVTSPQAAVRLLTGLVPTGSTILVVGGEGLSSEVIKAGYLVTDSALAGPVAVIQGFFQDIGWKHLAEASFALGDNPDMPWVATNTDWTIPVARGIAPGNGTLVAAVHSAVGRLPLVGGKPEPAIFEEAVARFGAKHPIFVGDRLDTDIVGANRAGMDSVLVLTGIDGAKQVLAADAKSRPGFILEDLRGLHEPYPATVETTEGDDRLFAVGEAVVRLSANTVSVDRPGTPIDLLRAGTSAVWQSGTPIYGLEVAPEIYSGGSV